VKSSGSGYVDYFWAKPGKDEPVEKSSYVQGFEPWKFIVGTGIYIDDIDELFWQKSRSSMFLLVVTLVIVVVIARIMTQDMVVPLREIVTVMKKAANGDFQHKIDNTDRKDELGDLSRSFISMQDAFRNLINHCKDGSEEMSSSAQVMNDVTTRTTQGVDQQYSETEQLASAIEELAMTIQEVANNAAETSNLTNETNTQINLGNEMMSNTITAISSVSDDMTEASEVIGQLESDVQQIDTILGVIRNISEQTNLLALNAAIEAARAGESGRGFAVVADEVRSLAQRTHESTEEIQAMTEALQSAAANAVKVMEAGKVHTQSCVDNAQSTGECLEIAGTKVAEVTDRNNMIAATVEQQGIVANEVSQNVISIKEVAQETHEGASTLSQHSEELQKLTNSTRQLLDQYKI
jgi:methyl-accepting chemotaxis protein